MNIVHIYDGHEKVYDGRGSVPEVVWKVAQETATAGHDVTIVERQWDGSDATAIHKGVRFKRLDLTTGGNEPWSRVPYEMVSSRTGISKLVIDRINFAFTALRKIQNISFDIIHVHLPFAANVLLTVAPWLRKKTVYTAHLGELRLNSLDSNQSINDPGNGETMTPSILSTFSPDMYLAKRAATTVALNNRILETFIENGVNKESLSVIPNGVDIDRFSNVKPEQIDKIRESYRIGEGPTLLFVGTVMPRKGVTDLIRALEKVLDDTSSRPELMIVGEDTLDGDYVDNVRDLIQKVGVADNVSFTGFVPDEDLPALYSAADIFVIPSLEEGFGMTAIEAFAAGTPVIGTRVGAIPTIMNDGEYGKLVDPGNSDQLANAIKEVLLNSSRNKNTNEKLQKRARDFTWESVGKRYVRLYERILSK